jgi:phospholipid transport system substrate-binding protein
MMVSLGFLTLFVAVAQSQNSATQGHERVTENGVSAWLQLAQGNDSATPKTAQNTQSASPSAVVARLQGALLEVIQEGAQLDYAGRYENLTPIIKETHDLSAIARVAVGQYWDQLGAAQGEFVDLFTRLSIAAYASQFESFSGEQFKRLGEDRLDEDTALVRTVLIQPNGEETHLDYLLRRSDGRWRIVNISYDGISDLALKRAEYTSVIRRDGIAALLAKMQSQLAKYEGTE